MYHLLLLLALVSLALALSPPSVSLPYDPANSAPTPIHAAPVQGILMSLDQVAQMGYGYPLAAGGMRMVGAMGDKAGTMLLKKGDESALARNPLGALGALAAGGPLAVLGEVMQGLSAAGKSSAQASPSSPAPAPSAMDSAATAGPLGLLNILGPSPTTTPSNPKGRLGKSEAAPSSSPVALPAGGKVQALPSTTSITPITAPSASVAAAVVPKMTCLDSSTNVRTINSLLMYGGAGTALFFCPGALVTLTSSILFTAPNQSLSTTPSTPLNRATLTLTGATESCAVYGAQGSTEGCGISDLVIDGSRSRLGYMATGLALVEMGGNSNQTVSGCWIFNARGWSCLHGIEGYNLSCRGMRIVDNQIGPSGNAPTGVLQFKRSLPRRNSKNAVRHSGRGLHRGQDGSGVTELEKRLSVTSFLPGEWADGISIACQASTVMGNTVIDATDGAIVIFGSPATVVRNNTIIAHSRQLLGGVNMVDYQPFSGSYKGVMVQQNVVVAAGRMIKLGIAVGPMNWGIDNATSSRTSDGVTLDNVFSSTVDPSSISYARLQEYIAYLAINPALVDPSTLGGDVGYFGYSISVAGVNNAVVMGNSYAGANYGGVTSAACFPQFPNPTPRPFMYNPYNTPNSTLQSGFLSAVIVLPICNGPGPILSSLISGT